MTVRLLTSCCWWQNFDLGWHPLNVGYQNDQSQNLEVVTNTFHLHHSYIIYRLCKPFQKRTTYLKNPSPTYLKKCRNFKIFCAFQFQRSWFKKRFQHFKFGATKTFRCCDIAIWLAIQVNFKLRRRYGHWIWANFNWKVFLKNFRKSGIFRFHIEFKDKSDNRLKNFSSRCFFLCCPLPASLSMICVRRAQHDDHGAPPSSFAIRFKPRARTTTRSPPRYRSTKHLYFLLKTLTLQTVSRDNFDRDY